MRKNVEYIAAVISCQLKGDEIMDYLQLKYHIYENHSHIYENNMAKIL